MLLPCPYHLLLIILLALFHNTNLSWFPNLCLTQVWEFVTLKDSALHWNWTALLLSLAAALSHVHAPIPCTSVNSCLKPIAGSKCMLQNSLIGMPLLLWCLLLPLASHFSSVATCFQCNNENSSMWSPFKCLYRRLASLPCCYEFQTPDENPFTSRLFRKKCPVSLPFSAPYVS